ncbi:MAG: PilZ domain-containing protein [Treponema sp.]|jgi:hypothetical protein|nr:PilZ domain-containing protein [Treponema sp.]
MKLMLLACSEGTSVTVGRCAKAAGFDVIRYSHPLKLMDNIDEVDPDVILVSGRDFPKQWQTVLQFVRAERPKEACPLIILTGKSFSGSDAENGRKMGLSGVIREEPETEVSQLPEALSRVAALHTGRAAFAFVHPESRALVTGEVRGLSEQGLSLLPDYPSLTEGITPGTELAECSLRAPSDDRILSPVCTVEGSGALLNVRFKTPPSDTRG